jgi:hypothetical protein
MNPDVELLPRMTPLRPVIYTIQSLRHHCCLIGENRKPCHKPGELGKTVLSGKAHKDPVSAAWIAYGDRKQYTARREFKGISI